MRRPTLCSEREAGGYEDCTWCAAVMLNNAHHGRYAPEVPSTRREYEALRVMGGDGPAENSGDGSNQAQAMMGINRRYRWTPIRRGAPGAYMSPDAFWAMLRPGWGASAQGGMGAFPRGHHLRRHDPGFAGPHDVYMQRESATNLVWWMDPLAPKGYPGEWVSKGDVFRYLRAFVGGYLFAPVEAPKHVHLAYGGHATKPFPDRTRTDEPDVKVHRSPTKSPTTVIDTFEREGHLYTAFQVAEGDAYAGSSRWYGDHTGRRWVHAARLHHEGGTT